MMFTPQLQELIFLLIISFIGACIAYFYGRKTNHFKWSEYLLLLCAPIGASIYLMGVHGVQLFYLFAISALIGFCLEYTLGFFYHKVLGERLWTYGKHNVGGYSSLLTFPMWGVAGIVFWLIAKSVGL